MNPLNFLVVNMFEKVIKLHLSLEYDSKLFHSFLTNVRNVSNIDVIFH